MGHVPFLFLRSIFDADFQKVCLEVYWARNLGRYFMF